MKFEFEIGDRVRTVEIHREATGFRVDIDGRAHHVDAARVHGDAWSFLVRDGDNGAASVDAVVVPQPAGGPVDVYLDGFHVALQPRQGRGRRGADRGAGGSGPQRVTAPMPGKVVRVLVKPGDAVQPRQGLVVVEAMKMENELRAAREGTVREVFVREGASVEAGAPLVVVE